MWTCPKCGRIFKRTNQGHYCGTAPKSVDEYIESQLPVAKVHAAELRNIILTAVPGVSERIAWSMPFFERNKHSVSFAICKKHISLYVESEILDKYKSQLSEFEIRKNAVYFPYTKDIPTKLVKCIIEESFVGNINERIQR